MSRRVLKRQSAAASAQEVIAAPSMVNGRCFPRVLDGDLTGSHAAEVRANAIT